MIHVHSLFSGIPLTSMEEVFTTLFEKPGLKIERITSHGQASPDGFWYDQPSDEWVLLVRGSATIEWVDQPALTLHPGDHLTIPSHTRHRVVQTSHDALWLAVHVDG
jgi:cupin 2 domain-containing protein